MKTLPALGIAFIVLRLCEVIGWSWWWVLAPFWIPLAVPFISVITILIFGSWAEQKEIFKRLGEKFR